MSLIVLSVACGCRLWRAAAAKAMSIGNLKQVWTNEGRALDWFNPKFAEGRWFLEHATQVKNIWVPYGE